MDVYIIFFVLIAECTSKLTTWKYNLRTYDGIDEDTAKYPYVVALRTISSSLNKIGTGSLITPKWVLSAAQCLKSAITHIQYGNMSLPLNQTDLKSQVLKTIQHPGYTGLTHNDIGLLLVNPVSMTKYGKLSAVEYETLAGFPAQYAGFGMTYFPNRRSHSKILHLTRKVTQPMKIGEGVLSTCKEPFTKNFMCLSLRCTDKQIVLAGDSGGALIFEDKIIGVALASTLNTHYQAFTPISSFLSWIRSEMFSKQT